MNLLSDLRLALRSLARTPSFACVAVLTLAIGIGANGAVFSFVDSLLIRSMNVANPDRLVMFGPGALFVTGNGTQPQQDHFSFAQLEAFQEFPDVFSGVAASPTIPGRLFTGERIPGETRPRVSGHLVSGRFFSVMGIRPFAGRWIEPSDDVLPTPERVAVISHGYWQRDLGGDAEAIGREIVLQDVPFEVIGIAPPEFHGHILERPADVWVPLSHQPELMQERSYFVGDDRSSRYWLNLFARLAPGVTTEQAEVVVNAEIRRLHEASSDEELRDFHVAVGPAAQGVSAVRSSLGQPLMLLYSATGLLLLIACANLASLMLSRASDRRREMGVRLALGASRWQVSRQLMSESFVLAAVGTSLGVAVAGWMVPAMKSGLATLGGPTLGVVQLDSRIVLFSAAVGLMTVLIFGVLPTLFSVRDGGVMLPGGAKGASLTSGRETRTHNGLVVVQVALSLILLTSTGLILRTMSELRGIDLGIEIENVIYTSVDAQGVGMPASEQDGMRRSILDRAIAIPGVLNAAFVESAPVSGNFGTSTTEVEGYDASEDESMNFLHYVTSEGYFDTFGIGLVEGRLLLGSDRYGETCVISESLARRYFDGRSAIGKTLKNRDEPIRIVGVVGDVRHVNLRDDPPPIVYTSATAFPDYLPTLVLRVQGDGMRLGPSIQSAVKAVAPQIPVSAEPSRMSGLLDSALQVERLLGWLTGLFGLVALLLAALGIFGAFNYAVRKRLGEFGIRQALGANEGNIAQLVLRQVGIVIAVGSVVGLLSSAYVAQLLQTFLYGVSALDPFALGGALFLQVAVGFAAAFGPARRAARSDPAELLRQE